MKLHIAFNVSTTIFRSSKYLRRSNLWNFKEKIKKAQILSSTLRYVLEESQMDKSMCSVHYQPSAKKPHLYTEHLPTFITSIF